MNRSIARGLVGGCLMLGLALVYAGCGGGESPDVTSGKAGQPGAEVLGVLPDFSLTDQAGESFGTAQLRGHVWVASFIFSRCGSTCPVQTRTMATLQGVLQQNRTSEGVRLVSISVDPEFDSPKVLRDYATEYQADLETWSFLTGERESIWSLCKEGFKLPVADDPGNEDMPIFHDTKLILVDRMGQVRGYHDGMSEDGLRSLLEGIKVVLPEIEIPEYGPDLYADSTEPVTHIAHPPQLMDTDWMESRRTAQLAAAEQFRIYHEFGFSDQWKQSGITFLPQIVDEQRWRLHVNHYDHGYGLVIADVDVDGRSDIYFVNQAGDNELWRNAGGGRFENITERAGVGVPGLIKSTASFADTDNDGDPDLYVTTTRGGNRFFVNDGSGVFADRTAESGLGHSGHSIAPTFFDYDRDGRLDVFLSNVGSYTIDEYAALRMDPANSLPDGEYRYYVGTTDAFAGHLKPHLAEANLLFRNEGDNRFVDVSEAVGLVDLSWSGDATPLDLNDDGWLDLYVLNMQGHDEYFENVEGQRFVKKSRELFPKTPWGAMGVKVFDVDNDGSLDLYLTDMHSDMSEDDVRPEKEKERSRMYWPESFLQSGGNSLFGNALYLSDGKGQFEEVSQQYGAENYWPWGLSVGDLNADGFEDVFLSSGMCFPFRYGINSVLLNDRGERFLDSEFVVGVEPRPEGRLIKPWFELDASGEDRNHAVAAGREGKLLIWSALGSRSSVIFDLDDDGDLDIVTNDFNARPMVLVSDLAQRKSDLRYLNLELVGTTSNRDGFGAIVRVHAGGKRYTKVYDGKSGYISQSQYPLYFGLGSAKVVDRIEVQWPSGRKQTVRGPIQTNKLVTVKES